MFPVVYRHGPDTGCCNCDCCMAIGNVSAIEKPCPNLANMLSDTKHKQEGNPEDQISKVARD